MQATLEVDEGKGYKRILMEVEEESDGLGKQMRAMTKRIITKGGKGRKIIIWKNE